MPSQIYYAAEHQHLSLLWTEVSKNMPPFQTLDLTIRQPLLPLPLPLPLPIVISTDPIPMPPPSPSVSASHPSYTPSPSRPPTSRHSRTPHQPLHTNFHSPLTTQPSTPTSHSSRCPPCRSDQPTKKRTDERGGKKARRKGKERKGKGRTYSNLLPQKLHILLAPAQRRPRRLQLLPQQRLGVGDGVRQHDVRA